MKQGRKEELADWLRYTEDPDYISVPTDHATTQEPPVPEEDDGEDYL